jgi:peroxiredoxin
MPSRSQAKEFEKAVDTLLNKARANKAVYEYIAGYLLKGFSDYGFDLLVDRIVENYVVKDNLNIRQKLKKSLRKRINQAKYLGRGMKAPNIVLPDTAGKVVDLSEIKAERTLVLFYASWCPHCRKNLPTLVKLYNAQKKKKIEVVAVSIDTVKTEWIKTIKKYKMNFTNLSDLKGWESKAARDYYIYATPTMFLLDENMHVVSKPQTIEEVKKIFRNMPIEP